MPYRRRLPIILFQRLVRRLTVLLEIRQEHRLLLGATTTSITSSIAQLPALCTLKSATDSLHLTSLAYGAFGHLDRALTLVWDLTGQKGLTRA
jgi:hypothetical protein